MNQMCGVSREGRSWKDASTWLGPNTHYQMQSIVKRNKYAEVRINTLWMIA